VARAPILRPSGNVVPDVERIVVLRANSIGDFLLAIPALDALRARYPAAEITYLGAPWHPELLEGRPGPWDRVAVVPPYPGVRDPETADRESRPVGAFFDEQRERRYDLAVQLHGGGRNSNPFVQRLGARLTVGSRAADAAPLDRWTPYAPHQHETLRFLEVVGLVGAAPVTLEPQLAVTRRDKAEADEVLALPDGPVVAVHAGATDPRRRWPPARFARVADELACRGARIVLLGGRDDAVAAAEITAAMRHDAVDLVGRLSLRATTGLLARCVLLVGNDSGPRHLAAAVGTATVSVYWCGNLVNAGPLTRRRHRVAVSFRITCPACGLDQTSTRCAHNPSFVADVQVSDVLPHALDLYERRP
jgi:ADP-heptose:LPS heptosyltransferase